MDILIVDNDKSARLSTSLALEAEGHYVEAVESGSAALCRIKEENFDLVFLDPRLGDEDGMAVLEKIVAMNPQPLVTICTAHVSIPTAVQATRIGAFDYLEKPFTPEQLMELLAKARQARNRMAHPEDNARDATPGVRRMAPPISFLSRDDRTKRQLDVLFRAAATPATIMILGESGTGKSLIAREVHERSHLRDKPYITVSCPSLSKELLESVLFGHVKGSFTGAVKDTWGEIHAAEGGTLFLDEVGDLPMEIQPKLLRFLQEKEYERLGENKLRHATVRVIAATNRDLGAEVRAGNFRDDLFYRLNVVTITLPPLRERPSDLEHFAKEYLAYFSTQLGRRFNGFSDAANALLMRHSWPGNLRELRNAIERAAILSKGGEIEAGDLADPSARLALTGASQKDDGPGLGGEYSLAEIEHAHIVKVLGWAPSLHHAASVLGIDKATLYRKRRRFSID